MSEQNGPSHEVCLGCGRVRPFDEFFLGGEVDGFHCLRCREHCDPMVPAVVEKTDYLAVRERTQKALREAGMDEYLAARKLQTLLYARKPYWNPAAGQWNFFPDYAVQMRATEGLLKALDALPRPSADETYRPSVVIISDLFSDRPHELEEPQSLVLEVKATKVAEGEGAS